MSKKRDLLKIAQVCQRYSPRTGGVQTHVREVSERLVQRGFEVEVLTTDPSEELPKQKVINGVLVKRFKSWAPSGAYYFSEELKKYLAKSSDTFDVVHAHNYHSFPAFYAARTKGRNKFVFTLHYHGRGHSFFRSLLHIPYRYIAKKIVEKADKVVCISSYEKSLVMKKFKISQDKIALIPNGINPKEFESLEKKKDEKRSVILYVGRLEKYKGIDYLIKVLPKLNSDIHLKIVGEGAYKKALVNLVDRLGTEDKVRFYQGLSREELLHKYAEANLFVLLSKYEAYGISVAEALAAKTPCIVANTSALKEWIDGKNCFGIDYPIDIEKLACMINDAMGITVDGVRLTTWDDAVEKLVQLYKSITECTASN